LYIESDALTISDSVFTDNTGGIEAVLADVSTTGCDFFGHESPAVGADTSDVQIDDCYFNDNRNHAVSLLFCSATVTGTTFDANLTNGLDGAGLWADCVGGNVIDISDCIFVDNVAINGRGGGVYINAGNPHSLIDCHFSGNLADAGGGAWFPRGDVRDCTFTGNAAMATSLGDGGGLVSDKNIVVRCEFRQNTSTGRGGGAFSSDGTGNFGVYYNCIFSGNESLEGTGGGVWANATRMMNCLVVGNVARFGGGGMYINNTSEIVNCTVVGNNSVLEDFNGALIDGNCTVTNSIFWDNNGSLWENNNNLNNSLTTFSVVQGLDMDFLGANNTGADPMFLDADGPDDTYGTIDDDCRLLSGSSAIDAGSNLAVPADDGDVDDDGNTAETTPLDLADMNRFVDDPASADTGAGTAPLVDMGAYEFVPGAAAPPCAGDVDGDHLIDFGDLNLVLALWGSTDVSADLDESGLVDFGDLNEVLARWGQSCNPQG
ncbi:MAG: right-handed parallel beta-helix repeat-containing protein, partial [Phycisphaerales bacterium]|nr:right-handed parallel beta-helix repeat-containing protein [Phycisphaerales bacterium]